MWSALRRFRYMDRGDVAARSRRAVGFAKVGAPLMERAMRRANSADLRRIKAILEG